MALAKVNFISTVLTKYNGLAAKDANTLYFLEDAKKIYKGDVDVTEAVKVVAAFDETPGADIVEGKLYFNATTFEVRVKNGEAWATMLPGIIAAAEGFTDENATKLATIGVTKSFIMDEINKITGGTAFVKGIEWKEGALHVDNGAEAATVITLEGVAHDLVYDKANLKLTIPVYGAEDIVVDIPKDQFVRDGRYEAEYDLPDGSRGAAIVLVIDSEDADTDATTKEIVIPATALVNDYEGGQTNTLKITISDGHEITGTVIVDPTEGNALVATETGLRVDISAKADKLTEDAATHILVGSKDGNLADSGLTLKTTGEMGESATEVPVAALIAEAIAKAVKAVQDDIQTKLDAITNAEGTGRLDVLEETVRNIGDSIVGEGDADEVVVSTESGIVRSGKKLGGATLAETADEYTLATEAAVADALAWKTIE